MDMYIFSVGVLGAAGCSFSCIRNTNGRLHSLILRKIHTHTETSAHKTQHTHTQTHTKLNFQLRMLSTPTLWENTLCGVWFGACLFNETVKLVNVLCRAASKKKPERRHGFCGANIFKLNCHCALMLKLCANRIVCALSALCSA